MPETHEWMFYEMMWRAYATGNPMPLPWWVQEYFRRWVDSFDEGLFESKETARQAKTFATTVGVDQRSVVLARFRVESTNTAGAVHAWFCLAISPFGPTGFKRRDRTGRSDDDRRINLLKYLPAEQRLLINTSWGPIFDSVPMHFGVYGNGNS